MNTLDLLCFICFIGSLGAAVGAVLTDRPRLITLALALTGVGIILTLIQ